MKHTAWQYLIIPYPLIVFNACLNTHFLDGTAMYNAAEKLYKFWWNRFATTFHFLCIMSTTQCHIRLFYVLFNEIILFLLEHDNAFCLLFTYNLKWDFTRRVIVRHASFRDVIYSFHLFLTTNEPWNYMRF